MKKANLIVVLSFLMSASLHAQTTQEITSKNSWLKVGAIAGIPTGNLNTASKFMAGIDLKGQLMTTPHIGIGLTTGYNHFFVKEGFGKDFGTIPLGAFIRVYPEYKGFFVGTDLGYSLVTGTADNKGGFYVRPQLGYHNYNWNFFGFYNSVFRNDTNGGNISAAGIGFDYNLHFK